MMQRERAVTSDISALLQNKDQFTAAFEEEANFSAGKTQIHTHSPTCVKYSPTGKGKTRDRCRFNAPWKLVDKTGFTEDGVLHIRRTHPMVNRWNQAMAIGLRHNHDVSFIGTQRKTMALVFYLTNYATKAEDPVWKRTAAAAELLDHMGPHTSGQSTNNIEESDPANEVECGNEGQYKKNKTRQFLMRVANRIFTERTLSHVEVVSHLLGYGTEFTNNKAWTFLNVSLLYWHVFRYWAYLRRTSGMDDTNGVVEERVIYEESGERISILDAYPHRGTVLQQLSLYDYASIVKLKRKGKRPGNKDEVEFEQSWPLSRTWIQILRREGEHAIVCLDGHLSMDFNDSDELHYKRYV